MGERRSKIYRCGEVEILPARCVVQVGGEPQHLRPKSLELLEYLISHRDRLVAKNELLDQLWKDTAVNEHAPAQCVIELRKALGDDARNPRFIRTVSKLGYQFIGPVEETMEPEHGSIELEEVLTTQVEIEGGANGVFKVTASALPFTLQSGASTSTLTEACVTVTFVPMSAGAASASLVITSNDPNSPVTVTLSGTATAAGGGGTGGGTGGSIALSSVDAGNGTYNLSTEGLTDWVHWGGNGTNYQAKGGNQITLTSFGGGVSVPYGGDARTLTWTDGDPPLVTQTGDNSGLHNYQQGSGYTLTMPANKAPTTLILHVGGSLITATLNAQLSDNSGQFPPDTYTFSPQGGDRNYKIVYNAATDGQTLTP